MLGIQSPWLSALLGCAAFILGLSVLVQIVQEAFKFLSSSKGRAFSRALTDFLGPWAAQLSRANFQLTARGPFQFLRIRPKGLLLPMSREQMASALERTAPQWIQKVHKALNQEMKWQNGGEKTPSPAWRQMLNDLGTVEKGMLGFWNAYEIAQWLEEWAHQRSKTPNDKEQCLGQIEAPKTFNAKELLDSFQERFLSHVLEANSNFPQFEKNFEYTYRRKNLKQTIFIALILSFAFRFSIDRIWDRAQRMSPQEAASLAETYLKMYQQMDQKAEDTAPSPVDVQNKLEEIKSLLKDYSRALGAYGKTSREGVQLRLIRHGDIAGGKNILSWPWLWAWTKYILLCFLTALLVGVGAPVWNDVTSFLLGLQQGKFRKPLPETGGGRG